MNQNFIFSITAGKPNKAFLDLLLDTSENNPETFPEKSIQNEVETFMFAVRKIKYLHKHATFHQVENIKIII